MQLHTTTLGETGSRIVFLHGLFGQGRNWHTLGRTLAAGPDGHRVTLVDLPNHGRSPWTDHVDYVEMAEAVAGLLDADDPVTLVGHSMGGKVAMLTALLHPQLVARLVVADMSPVDYPVEEDETTGGVLRYARILRDVDLASFGSRAEVEAALLPQVPNDTIRAFLMQNLHRVDPADGGGWRWAANVDVLARDGAALASWPAKALAEAQPYAGPVLWIAGGESSYVRPEFDEAMHRWFPQARKVTMKGVGHWVHSEKPELFLQILQAFLAR
ncbi:alpha/beta fold hydrolase [Nocardioides sp. Kera G14]|uniref:alpha/beta fold hydrolase n=1 Tax=Nocardioides sp. Kera G14 TaxID=2884264 RepID=UPI001D11A877|nr:alpha/beta fold hydrolase [Nocardioides sp. Kera G14]UDY24748.1 alpha/beta fold hydrolase [Nocardioides sp. Kera G14]